MEENKEKCIGRLIYRYVPIEWMRYNMYIAEDRYRSVPMLVFRTQVSCPQMLIDKLKECVETFEGSLKWRLFKDPLSNKGNYLLTISELEQLHIECRDERIQYNQMDYFGIERYKKYCDEAIEDIPKLARHIADNLDVICAKSR